MNPAHCVERFAWRMLRLPAAALLAMSVAACAQAPEAGGSAPAPAPAAPAPEAGAGPAAPAPAPAPAPKLRGIKPAELPREEPGVGLGGLTHEPAQPAQ